MAKSPNLSAKIWYGLTVHICFLILNLQSKIFQFFKFTLVFWQKFQRIMQIPRNSPYNSTKHAKFAPFIYVSDACPSRELSKIPANQAKFAPFAHILRE